jgi:hypothetical protein
MNDVHNYGGSWKRLYLERHMQEYIENLNPEDFVQSEAERLVHLSSPYVKRFNIWQLQASRSPDFTEEDDCECSTEVGSADHINLQPFIKGLVNLEVC